MDMKTHIVLLSLGYICYCMNTDPEPVSQLDLDKFTGCWFMVSIHLNQSQLDLDKFTGCWFMVSIHLNHSVALQTFDGVLLPVYLTLPV